MNRTNTLIILAIAGTGLLAACGGDDPSTPAVAAAAPAPAVASVPPATSTTVAAAGSTVAVKSADSELGPILVGVDGRTLYGFTNDTPDPEQLRGHVRRGLAPGRRPRQLDGRARRRQRDLQHDHAAGRHAAARRRQVPAVRLLGRHRTR